MLCRRAAPLFGYGKEQFMTSEKQIKGTASALLPIGVFHVFSLGAGIECNDCYAMPVSVAFLTALFVAFLQNRNV